METYQKTMESATGLIDENVRIISVFYIIATVLFISFASIHLFLIIKFSTIINNQLEKNSSIDINYLYYISIISIVFLLIELMLLRTGLSMAARAGQLRDFKLVLTISQTEVNIQLLEASSTTLQKLLRQFKIIDIESMIDRVKDKNNS